MAGEGSRAEKLAQELLLSAEELPVYDPFNAAAIAEMACAFAGIGKQNQAVQLARHALKLADILRHTDKAETLCRVSQALAGAEKIKQAIQVACSLEHDIYRVAGATPVTSRSTLMLSSGCTLSTAGPASISPGRANRERGRRVP